MKILNQQLIKHNNLKQVFSLVGNHEGISRANLAAITQLSKTTVSALVEELIVGGFLVDEGAAQTNRQGRKPNSLRVNGEDNVIAVIGWHPKRLQAAFVGLDDTITCYREQSFADEDDYMAQIADMYHRLRTAVASRRTPPRVLALCIIVPSIIDPQKKRMFSSVLPMQAGDWVIRRLRAAIPEIPMAVFNDTACFAYAETAFGLVDESPSIFVNLSGGVGAVMFSDGKMLRGANGMTTQFGHFSVDRNGALCRCGNRGCLECRIGESVLVERASEFMTADCIEAFGRMSYETVGAAADSGDAGMCLMLDAMAKDLAYALANLITVYNVPRAILGGRGRKLGNYFFERLEQHIEVCGFREFVSACELRYSRVPSHADFCGAARYFMDMHFRFDEDMNGELFLR